MSFAMNEEQRMAVDGLRRYLDDVIEPEFRAHGEGSSHEKRCKSGCRGWRNSG